MSETANLDKLVKSLRELSRRWESLAHEQRQQAEAIRFGSSQHAYQMQGMAEGLQRAADDLNLLLEGRPAFAQAAEEGFVAVSHESAMTRLQAAGLSISELHAHPDHTFSAIFSALQGARLQESVAALQEQADIEVLASGRLSNSNRSYIDFGFRSPTAP